MKITTLVLALTICGYNLSNAQQALDASGGSFQVSPNLIIDYSVGEVATATTSIPDSSNSYIVGVIQPTLGLTGTENLFDELYYIQVFPNPVEQKLNIATNYKGFHLFQFTNILGQQVSNGSFEYEPIDVSWMASGIYLLTLTSTPEQISKTIKIIKQ